MGDSLKPAMALDAFAKADPAEATAAEHSAIPRQAPSRSKMRTRMLRVFGAHTLGNLVTLADRFLLLPVMLYVWGPTVTGVWLTIRSVPAVLSVGELGFASATGNKMTEHVAKHETDDASRVYWSTSKLINTISMVCMLGITLVALCLPLTKWFKADAVAVWEFNAAVLLMAVYTVSIFQTQLYYAGYRSIDRQATAAFGTHLTRIGEFVLVIAALFLSGQVWAVAAAYVIARLTGALLLRTNLLRQAKWLSTKPKTNWSDVRPLLKPALGFASLPLAQTFQLQGSTLAVAAATNPEIVAAFTAMRTLARFPIQFCSSVGRTTWPELSQSLARHEYPTALRLHRRSVLLSLALSAMSVIGLLLCGQWVYSLWTSNKLEFTWLTFALLSISAGLIAFSTNAMTVLNAMSVHGRASAIWVALALLSVLITVVFPRSLGLNGISLVLLVCDVAVLIYVMWATKYHVSQLQALGAVETGN